ncbi:hypothetical protein [Lentzea flaviverrucosa]|uniref:Uncharacterized protein n=1 Tax=Lentzea flaviverrucosa TaxID=200379 RepID=A0A1H9EXL3_9PSEU|nr:hypothetical protein [Lentzea flaviverrucosa]RDI35365.1 hypothetical protein DFR72_1011116 [Lentzea flaviverrucosa]SEQ30450.1 hypothetical protein SAMN05216195_102101 [Lentzea flaviverrucosa]
MDEVLAGTLRSVVYERLDYLELLVANGDAASLAALAETELARLASAWRALLALHEPNERGRCPQCSGWRRGRLFPCSVWVVAHDHLISADHVGRCATVANHHTGAKVAAS